MNITIPSDLAERAVTTRQADLARHYGISSETISRWLKKLGVQAWRPDVTDYSDLPVLAKTMWVSALARHYGKKCSTINHQLKMRGIEAARPPASVFRNSGRTYPRHAMKDRKVSETSDRAADFLRRFCPVYRCNADGRPDLAGKFWLYGRRIMTPDELIERAEAKGWDANGWRLAA